MAKTRSLSRPWIWLATACGASALLLLLFVSVEWTPDCGGIAYGFPLPFMSAQIALSNAFSFFVGPFLIDLLVYMAILSVPAWLFARHARKQSVRRRRLYAGVLALVVVLDLGIGSLTVFVGGFLQAWPKKQQLYVHEWRAEKLVATGPRWGRHLEDQCN